MRVLITAGNTQVPLDRVRCVTNIFTGRTGALLAEEACERGHRVTLLTSHPEVVPTSLPLQLHAYRTFEDLAHLVREEITTHTYDAVLHSAAVSDYLPAGVFSPDETSRFDPQTLVWSPGARLIDRSAPKIKSEPAELWLRMVKAPKLIDFFRRDWGYVGVLVKFKLEVSVSDAELLAIAEASRRQSQADWMVANTLEEATDWAYLGPFEAGYRKVPRPELARELISAVEVGRR